MDELIFPAAALAVTFALIIPALTCVSRAVLARRRASAVDWASFGSEATFAWLVAPTLLPLIWLLSAATHQLEPARAQSPCLVPHLSAPACADALFLVAALILGGALVVSLRAWRERPRVRHTPLPSSSALATRVARLIAREPQLHALRVSVVCGSADSVFTVGWLRPRVMLDDCFVHEADDAMLRAALLHERAHVIGRDPLRGFIARLCLSLNPARRLLAPDLARWRSAREALCDGDAVHHGGAPLALAESIVRAARFQCAQLSTPGAALLCGHDAAALRLRLTLLLHQPPRPSPSRGHLALTLAALLALALPHVQELGALDHFHLAVERLLSTIP